MYESRMFRHLVMENFQTSLLDDDLEVLQCSSPLSSLSFQYA